jgi:predicted PurR-regulated permease PerM
LPLCPLPFLNLPQVRPLLSAIAVTRMRIDSIQKAQDPRSDEPSGLDTSLDARTVSLVIIAVGVTIFLLQQMQALFAPLAFGILLFYALDPIVDFMERIKIPRWIGAALALGLIIIGLGAGTYALQDEAMTVINQLPTGARRLTALFERKPRDAPGPMEKVQQAADELQKSTETEKQRGVVRVQVEEPFSATNFLWSGSVNALSALNQLIMIFFLTYFILLGDKMFKRKFVELAGPTLAKRKVTVEIIDSISDQIGRFLLVQVFTSIVVGVVTWAALRAMGLQQPALWGLMAGVFNSIPYYGPLIVSGALAGIAFLQFGTFSMTLAVAGVSLVITSLEGWILTPTLMGKVAEMNRVAVFVGLLFWSWVWGIWGMLLAVPLMMAIKVICDHVEDLQPVGRFLGD